MKRAIASIQHSKYKTKIYKKTRRSFEILHPEGAQTDRRKNEAYRYFIASSISLRNCSRNSSVNPSANALARESGDSPC